MIKDIWRFRYSLLPGVFISFLLLFFAFDIFFTLFRFSFKENIFISFDSRIFSILEFTVFQATLSTLLSVVFGISIAWAIHHRRDFLGRDFLIAIISSSLVLPTLVVVMGIVTVLGRSGWINMTLENFFGISPGGYIYGLSGILIAHVYLNASYSARSFLHKLQSIPQERYKLSSSLGLSAFRRFFLVEFVALKDSLLPVASTIFLLCFTSFAIVLTLGGNPSYNTLEVAIYEAVKLDFDIALALRLALVQLGISIFWVVLSSSLSQNISNIRVKSVFTPYFDGAGSILLQRLIIFIAFIFFVSPLIAIVVDGLRGDIYEIVTRDIFIKSFKTSVYIAFVSSLFCVIFSIFISMAKRDLTLGSRLKSYKYSGFFNFILSFVSILYLAIPSIILGLALFLMARESIFTLNSWAVFALICANVLLSLPFSISVLAPIAQKVAQRYDKLSLSLGLKPYQRWIFVEYPFLKESIGYILALSFCFSLGDLGVIALFGNEDFTTLPWYLYGLMGSYRTTDASSVALVLLGIVLSVFIFVPKIFKGSSVVKN